MGARNATNRRVSGLPNAADFVGTPKQPLRRTGRSPASYVASGNRTRRRGRALPAAPEVLRFLPHGGDCHERLTGSRPRSLCVVAIVALSGHRTRLGSDAIC